ncbi:MAG: hypothetical protein WD904_11295 [Dehalococcoidia bacterium]
MTISWRAAAAALDAGTALFAAANAAYFVGRLLGSQAESPGRAERARRTAVFVLALISLGAPSKARKDLANRMTDVLNSIADQLVPPDR